MTNFARMLNSLMAVAGASSMFVTQATEVVAQTVPPNLPAAIMCYAKSDQSWRVGYLHKVNKNGDALYLSPDGRLGATIDAKGIVVAPTNRPAALDCYGKTLDELRANGRTMEF
jgi:hypothetical protein